MWSTIGGTKALSAFVDDVSCLQNWIYLQTCGGLRENLFKLHIRDQHSPFACSIVPREADRRVLSIPARGAHRGDGDGPPVFSRRPRWWHRKPTTATGWSAAAALSPQLELRCPRRHCGRPSTYLLRRGGGTTALAPRLCSACRPEPRRYRWGACSAAGGGTTLSPLLFHRAQPHLLVCWGQEQNEPTKWSKVEWSFEMWCKSVCKA